MPHRVYMKANPENGRDEDWRFVKVPPALPDNEQTRRDIADYNASVKHMDKCCGIVLDALKKSGQEDNTIVIATTDHGIAFPHMKCNLTDQGAAIYLIMKGPEGFDQSKCIDAMVTHLDVYPTICEVLGIEPNKKLHGKSLMPLVRGETDKLHDEIFFEVSYHAAYQPMRSVRTDRYKLVKHFNKDWTTTVLPNCDNGYSKTYLCEHGWRDRPHTGVELYDLVFDPCERNNLAEKEEYSEIIEDLEGRLQKWMEETDDQLATCDYVTAPDGAIVTPQDRYSPNGEN
jgi:arylsulfatase A-like enzyme